MAEHQTRNPEDTMSSLAFQQDIAVQQFTILSPYDYQISIYSRIKKYWRQEYSGTGKGYGNIVYLETGTGKTYIAVMLIKHLFDDQVKKLDNGSYSKSVSPSLPSSIAEADGPDEIMEEANSSQQMMTA